MKLDIYRGGIEIQDRMWGRRSEDEKVTIVIPHENGDFEHDTLIRWIKAHVMYVRNVELEDE